MGSITIEDDGWLVRYEDHLAAMKEQEERMMRFAEWYAYSQAWTSDCGEPMKHPLIGDVQEAFQYFLDNVEGKKK